MGPMSRDERIMLAVMVAAIVMWVLGDQLSIAPVTAAMLGLSALLFTGVLKWKECLEYNQACAHCLDGSSCKAYHGAAGQQHQAPEPLLPSLKYSAALPSSWWIC